MDPLTPHLYGHRSWNSFKREGFMWEVEVYGLELLSGWWLGTVLEGDKTALHLLMHRVLCQKSSTVHPPLHALCCPRQSCCSHFAWCLIKTRVLPWHAWHNRHWTAPCWNSAWVFKRHLDQMPPVYTSNGCCRKGEWIDLLPREKKTTLSYHHFDKKKVVLPPEHLRQQETIFQTSRC